MEKKSELVNGRVLILDWDGVIDLTSDDKYAYELGKIDYRTTREYAEKVKEEFDVAEKSSEESFDHAQKTYAEKMREHYALKDKYLLERESGNLMMTYYKSIREIAKFIIKKDLKDENLEEMMELLKEEFPKKDKYMIGRFAALLVRVRKKVALEVDKMIEKDCPDEDREELIDIMTELTMDDILNNPELNPIEVYGKVPYRKIIRGISSESQRHVINLATCGRYDLTIIGTHCNVKREAFLKAKVISKLFAKYGIIYIPIPFYPTILKDGLTKEQINDLRIELQAFDIDLDQENKPTSKINYVRYYLYKYYNMFIENASQVTLIDNSSRNISDCNQNGGVGIYFKPRTSTQGEVGSLELNEVINAEDEIIHKKGK